MESQVKPAFWRDRNVFVTGATGLLGTSLTQRLLDLGANVTVLIRDFVPHSHLMTTGAARRTNVVCGAVEDIDVIERALNEYEIDAVFHLAAQTIVGTANRNPLSTFEANIKGTWVVLEACRRSPLVKRVLVASSDKAYGDCDTLPYNESTPLRGQHPYDVSKSCADLIAQSYHKSYGLPVAVTRCGNFYGGGDLNFNRLIPGTIRSILRGDAPVIRSDGKYIRDYIYVKDGAEAYLLLGQKLEELNLGGQAFNFSYEVQLSVLDLTQRIMRLMGREDLKPRIMNEAKNEIRHQFLSAEKAKRVLGWKPLYDLEPGLKETIESYRKSLSAEAVPRSRSHSGLMLRDAVRDRLSGISSRGRRLLLGVAALFAGRGSSTVMTLATTALVARRLSRPEFGFWVVLTGLPTLIAQFDLGVGNALRNKLTVLAAGNESDAAAKIHFLSSLLVFLCAAAALSILSAAVVPFLPWTRILSFEVAPLLPVAPLLTTFAAISLLFSLAVSLGGFGFYAYQETHLNAALDTFRAFCIFLFTAAAALVKGGVPSLIAAYFSGFLIGSTASLVYFLRRRGWSLTMPSWGEVRSVWRDLRGDSSRFFLLQMSAGLIIYTDSLLVVRAAGFGPAGDYALVQKIFLYLIAVQFMGLVPLWTAFTDAHARGDHAWVRRMFQRSFWMTLLVTGAGAVVLAILGPALVQLWTGKVVIERVLFPVMALWAALYGWCNCFSVPLNALGKLRRQAPLSFAAAVVNIPLCLWWGKLWGPVGICWAAVAVMGPVAVSNTFEVRSLLKSTPAAAS